MESHARNCLLQLVDGLRGNLGADEVDRLEAFDVLEGIESRVGYLGAAECQNLEVLEALRSYAGRIKRLPACPLGSQPSQTVDIGERRDDRLAEAAA